MSQLQTTHGETKTKLHMVWCGMKARCYNPAHSAYRYYGAKGIKVEGAFQDYGLFRDWAASNGYCEGLTLDRKDGTKNYTLENCRWATRTVQNRNSGSTHPVTFAGETHCLEEWAEITGINARTIRGRLRNGWTSERALTQPTR